MDQRPPLNASRGLRAFAFGTGVLAAVALSGCLSRPAIETNSLGQSASYQSDLLVQNDLLVHSESTEAVSLDKSSGTSASSPQSSAVSNSTPLSAQANSVESPGGDALPSKFSRLGGRVESQAAASAPRSKSSNVSPDEANKGLVRVRLLSVDSNEDLSDLAIEDLTSDAVEDANDEEGLGATESAVLDLSKIEESFPLCEGSIYSTDWESQFRRRWLAENPSSASKKRQDKEINEAQAQEYLRLLSPLLGQLQFDYPVIINDDVLKWLNYFQFRGRKAFVTWLRRAEDVIPLMEPVLEQHGLPKDLVYLAMIESGFNNRALSVARAAGPWQFMRATGRNFGLKLNDYVDERRDPAKATVAAARYLTILYSMFGDWHLAAAAYNAGEGRVGRALKKIPQGERDFVSLSSARVLPQETRDYVPKLIAAMIISKNPQKFGFEVTQGSRALSYRRVGIPKSVALKDLAKAIQVDKTVLETLNPELRLGVTPPSEMSPLGEYSLRVPESAHALTLAALDDLPTASRQHLIETRVRRRETLAQFAKRQGVALAALQKANPSLGKNPVMAKGQVLLVPYSIGSGNMDRLTGESDRRMAKSRPHRKGSKARMRSKRASMTPANRMEKKTRVTQN